MKLRSIINLVVTSIVISLILFFVYISVKGLVNEKNRILTALVISQENREQTAKSEKVTESFLKVEMYYKEYCASFKPEVLLKYKNEVNLLSENILNLEKSINDRIKDKNQINTLFSEKSKESSLYAQLRSTTDSLLFSSKKLADQHFTLESFAENLLKTKVKVDTFSVKKTVETKKKGLFGKLKSFVVGDKEKQSEDSKIVVNTTNEQVSKVTPLLSEQKQLDKKIQDIKAKGLPDIDKLVKRAFEMKQSELKLLEINNKLMNRIECIIDKIKLNAKKIETEQNESFLGSVKDSTERLQKILFILVYCAMGLAIYIIYLGIMTYAFQKKIIRLNKEITKTSAEKDKFYSVLSHDMMNAFNTLLGFSQLLDETAKTEKNKDIIDFSSNIHESAKRIFNLLQNLLTWSQLENGKISYVPDNVNVTQLLSDCMLIVQPMADKKGVSLKPNIDKNMTAFIDKNMINSVVQNLITNAIKFTPTNGVIRIDSHMEKDNLKIIVADNGVGMDEERQNKLFKVEKNNSERGTNNETGTGLGLVICKEFVEKHKGTILVSSKYNEGTTITVSIPS